MELGQNKLTGEDLDIIVKQCPHIYKIKLDSNEIKSLDILNPLTKLESLRKISVKGNPFCETNQNYQKDLFEMIKTLESIDSHNKEGEEVETSVYEDDEEEDDDKELKELSEEEDEGEEFNEEDVAEDEEYGEDDEVNDDGDEDNDDDDEDDDEDERPTKKQKK